MATKTTTARASVPRPATGTRTANGTKAANDTKAASDTKAPASTKAAAGSQPRLHQRGKEIQEFGTVRQFPIGLSAGARRYSCQRLNRMLADTQI
ncbi:MAG TPA: hypothetical protein VGG16_21805, partial [Streptosporangiaceae bacterium]